jgi:D-Tyr-tRNAtyr deacylase
MKHIAVASAAKVMANENIIGEIGKALSFLCAVKGDNERSHYTVKVSQLRIFGDERAK